MEFLFKIVASIIGVIGSSYTSIGGLEISLVNYGDGLYEKEKGLYVYKGTNPDNYFYFNDELWRIMYINNNSIKIIRNSSIGDMAFDESDNNDWEVSSLKRYLHNYYQDMNNKYKEAILGDIEIMSMDDYLQANSNLKLCTSLDLYFKNGEQCFKSNYINSLVKDSLNGAAWTLTKDENTVLYVGNTYFNDIKPSDFGFGVLPVVYLSKNTELWGRGTLQNPYKIRK